MSFEKYKQQIDSETHARGELHSLFARIEADKNNEKFNEKKVTQALQEALAAVVRAEQLFDDAYFEKATPTELAKMSNPWTALEVPTIKKNKEVRRSLHAMCTSAKDTSHRYARQLWRAEMVKFISNKLAATKRKPEEITKIMVKVMAGQKVTAAEGTPLEALADAGRAGDLLLNNTAVQSAIAEKMLSKDAQRGRAADIQNLFHRETQGDAIFVVVGGSLLSVPISQTSAFLFKNMVLEGDRIYAQMENGCRGNAVIIELAPLVPKPSLPVQKHLPVTPPMLPQAPTKAPSPIPAPTPTKAPTPIPSPKPAPEAPKAPSGTLPAAPKIPEAPSGTLPAAPMAPKKPQEVLQTKPFELPVGLTVPLPRQVPIPTAQKSKYPYTEWEKLPDQNTYYPVIYIKPVGTLKITGGFMEPKGHGTKYKNYPAIFPDGKLQNVGPQSGTKHFNIGIDYVVMEPDKQVKSWYSGKVVFSGLDGYYGKRAIVETNATYTHNGTEYKVYQAYSHLRDTDVSLGQTVIQGQSLGIMGGTGPGGTGHFTPHVDLRTFILPSAVTLQNSMPDHEELWIELSPNRLEDSLKEKMAHPQLVSQSLGAPLSPDQQAAFEARYGSRATQYAARIVRNGAMMDSTPNREAELKKIEAALHKRFRVHVPRWVGYVNDARETGQIASLHASRERVMQKAQTWNAYLPLEFIVGAMSNEGRLLNIDMGEGYGGPVSGFMALGLDTFGSEFQNIVTAGLLPHDFAKKFSTSTHTNELGGQVKSAEFETKDAALYAFTAMLAFRQKLFFDHARKLEITMDSMDHTTRPEIILFFTYIYYNAGPTKGHNLLRSICKGKTTPESKNAAIAEYFQTTKNNSANISKYPATFNSYVVLAGTQALMQTGILDENPEPNKYWWNKKQPVATQ